MIQAARGQCPNEKGKTMRGRKLYNRSRRKIPGPRVAASGPRRKIPEFFKQVKIVPDDVRVGGVNAPP